MSHVESIHREYVGVRKEMINIEKTVQTQNEINNEKEAKLRPGTPLALLIE